MRMEDEVVGGAGGLVLQAGAWWEFREPEVCSPNAGKPLGLCTGGIKIQRWRALA